MKKTFCDICGMEITRDNNIVQSDLTIKTGKINLILDKSTDFDVCKYCVIDAIKNIYDRLKPPNIPRCNIKDI